MAPATCIICCEKQTPQREVTCIFCGFTSCRKCVERYITDSTQASCMNCQKEWSYDFLTGAMTKVFMSKVYMLKHKDLLFEREKAFLPSTQYYADITQQVKHISEHISAVSTAYKAEPLDTYKEMLANLKAQKHSLQLSLKEDAVLEHYVCACPSTTCKGFVHSNDWTCGMCHIKCCEVCRVPCQGTEHVCKKEDIDTAKLLQNETKPCPKCKAPCTKVDGCDQVFAMCCKTTFSWSTGRIDKSNDIHAPDYLTWLRSQKTTIARHPMDIACGGLPDIRDIDIDAFRAVDNEKIWMAYSLVQHIQTREVPYFIEKTSYSEETNRDLRIKFLTDPKMTEGNFKTQLAKREKQRYHRHHVLETLQTFVVVLCDVLQRMTKAQHLSSDKAQQVMNDLSHIHGYMNETLNDLKERYKGAIVPRLDNDWLMIY